MKRDLELTVMPIDHADHTALPSPGLQFLGCCFFLGFAVTDDSLTDKSLDRW